ncbi:MAG TPA: patatin-like phospholipase family protein [Thermomicrobiaceae bacterium]|nr:patatin-like phospholipase family protein [Thermomicrobiaceae bacterium]
MEILEAEGTARFPLTAAFPAQWIETDQPDRALEPGIALCLSGGGYRAMLFHLGALWRLNHLGFLPRIARISSVSGGSITAGVLGMAWSRLGLDASGVGVNFEAEVVGPIRRLADQTIDVPAIVGGMVTHGNASDHVAETYRKRLFGDRTLQDLPDPQHGPMFVINAANLQTGALWRFSRTYAADWRVGVIPNPTITLATAVAASSAFPPILSPAILHVDESAYTPNSGHDLQHPPYTTRVLLTDGGVYDNLGLETAWKRYRTVLVSDGGGKMGPEPALPWDWIRQLRRVFDVVHNQIRSLRMRQVVESYLLPESSPDHRYGALWSTRSDVEGYHVPGTLPCPIEATQRLANLPTRLARVDATTQMCLINWGYASADAALRKYLDGSLPAPAGFPYPAVGVGVATDATAA